MAITLYNQTKWPDKLLRDLHHHAARRVGARNGIAIKVTTTRRGAYAEVYGTHGAFIHRRTLGLRSGPEWIRTDVAYMRLGLLPWCGTAAGAWDEARHMLHLLYHEWQHVFDDQAGGAEWSKRGANGRLPRWSERPEELRAEETADRLMDDPTPRAITLIAEVARFLRTDPRDP